MSHCSISPMVGRMFMFKHYKVVLSLGFVLLFICLLTFFRHPLVMKLANHYFLPPPIKLSCLEFSLNWQLDVDVSKICLSSDSFTLLGKSLSWKRQENSLSAQYIAIKLLPLEQQNSESTVPLSLPEGLPLINIQALEIDSPLLNKAIKLKVVQNNKQQFTLSANWQATLNLVDKQLSGDISWTLADIKALGLDVDFQALTSEQLNAPITSHFSFDGDQLVTQNTLDFKYNMGIEDCPLLLSAVGNTIINASLSSKQASLDFNLMQLQLQLASADCALLQDIPAELRSTSFAIVLNEPMILTVDNVQTSSLMVSSQNGPTIELLINQLQYEFSGKGKSDFILSVEQGTKLKFLSRGQLSLLNKQLQLDSKNKLSVSKWTQQDTNVMDFSSDFTLGYDGKTIVLSGQASANQIKLEKQKITIDGLTSSYLVNYDPTFGLSLSGQASANKLQLLEQDIAIDGLTSTYTFKQDPTLGLSLNGLASVKQLKTPTMLASELSSKFELAGTELDLLKIKLDNTIGQLSQDNNVVSSIGNQLNLTLTQQNLLQGKGASQVSNVSAMEVKLANLSAEHTFKLDLAAQQLTSHHNINLAKNFDLGLSTNNYLANIEIKDQAISALIPFSKQLSPKLSGLNGKLSANIQARLDTFATQGEINLIDVNASYEDILISKLNYAPEFTFDSGTLQFSPAKLRIESLNAGVPIDSFVASIEGSLTELVANKISLNLFAGTAAIEQFYLDGRDQKLTVVVNNIDLARLLELEKQSGIEVTGHIAGTLPMTLNKGALSIEQGRLYNQHDGKLRINKNAAFEALKAQQPSLSKKLSLLEQLNFEKLESDVNMTQDGQLKMNIAIVGFNPVAKETVNFNYGHEENVLVLLRALRLTDSLSKKIEQNIQNH
jgi:hypothetical protein